ncbi:MAG: hypothetical protein ACK51V_01195 [bacterium]|jgi:hypothetical protein
MSLSAALASALRATVNDGTGLLTAYASKRLLRDSADELDRLTAELAAAKKDTERLDTLQSLLFACRWNGVIGADCKWHWEVVGQWRHIVWRMVSKKQGDFRAAIDAAIAAQQPTEPK